MARSPSSAKAQLDDIIAERKNAEGSNWDEKIHEPTGLTYYDLRYKVGEAVVRGKKTNKEAREMFHVSKGFVSEWSAVFRARDSINDCGGIRRNRVSKRVFRSISNRPKNVVGPVQDEIRAKVVARRKAFCFEGAFRIKAALGIDASPTTINKVLRSEGLMGSPEKRHVNKTYGRFQRPWCLKLVQTDYKTWTVGENTFKSIWIMDDCTRFILAHRIVPNSSADVVIELLQEVIDAYGAPEQILSDHGSEFYSVSGGRGKSKLDRFCKDQGIEHIMGRVRHPQTQGKMERTHRSASEEVLTFGDLGTIDDARNAFSKWVQYYNWERPHYALNHTTPGAQFTSMYCLDFDELIEV